MSDRTITPNDLIEDLEYLRKVKDKRLLVLYFDLYLEHFIERIYSRVRGGRFPFIKSVQRLFLRESGIRFKIGYLIERGHLDPMFHDIARLIYDLRCELVHQLRPNDSKLIRWIESQRVALEDPTGLMGKFLSQTDPWVKLQMFVFPLIVRLYQKLERLSGRRPNQTIDFHINPEGTQVQMNLRKPKPSETL